MSENDFTFMMMFLSGTCAATSALGYLVYQEVKGMRDEFDKMSATVEDLFDRIDKSSGGGGGGYDADVQSLEDDVDDVDNGANDKVGNDPEFHGALQEEETTYTQQRVSGRASCSSALRNSSSTPNTRTLFLNSSDNFRRSSSFPIYPAEIISPVYD